MRTLCLLLIVGCVRGKPQSATDSPLIELSGLTIAYGFTVCGGDQLAPRTDAEPVSTKMRLEGGFRDCLSAADGDTSCPNGWLAWSFGCDDHREPPQPPGAIPSEGRRAALVVKDASGYTRLGIAATTGVREPDGPVASDVPSFDCLVARGVLLVRQKPNVPVAPEVEQVRCGPAPSGRTYKMDLFRPW